MPRNFWKGRMPVVPLDEGWQKGSTFVCHHQMPPPAGNFGRWPRALPCAHQAGAHRRLIEPGSARSAGDRCDLGRSTGSVLPPQAGKLHAPNHLVLGASSPIFGIAFGTEGLGRSRPAELANDCLPRAGRRLDDGRHVPVLRADCTENVLFNAQKAQGVT